MIGDPDASMHLNQDGLDLLSLKTLCELQQAQIKGLVESLTGIAQSKKNRDDFWRIAANQSLSAEKALNTLPAEFLEKERKRDAVVRVAKAYKDERDISSILDAVAALEASP